MVERVRDRLSPPPLQLLLLLTMTAAVLAVVAVTSASEAGAGGAVQTNKEETKAKAEAKTEAKAAEVAPCWGCRALAKAFAKAVEGKGEGEPAVEASALCAGAEWARARAHCEALATDLLPALDAWRRERARATDDEREDAVERVCVRERRVCCPDGRFGPTCAPCPEHPARGVCGGSGQCRGSGTRKGNGTCACERGYVGALCDTCALGFHAAYSDEQKLLCAPCHAACAGACSSAGPKACAACRPGWRMEAERGCVDVDECQPRSPCARNQFCVNGEGSFACLSCDRACSGCTGDGPDECERCARGYELRGGVCVDAGQLGRDRHVGLTRYLTYAGLCVATCIVLHKSVWLAAVVGLCVALYIAVAEYYLQAPSDPGGLAGDIAKLLGAP